MSAVVRLETCESSMVEPLVPYEPSGNSRVDSPAGHRATDNEEHRALTGSGTLIAKNDCGARPVTEIVTDDFDLGSQLRCTKSAVSFHSLRNCFRNSSLARARTRFRTAGRCFPARFR